MSYLYRITVLGWLLLAFSGVVAGQSSCVVSSVGGSVRISGETELGGDVVVTCTGGTPTPQGQAVPTMTITLTANTNITSRLLATGWSEALLVVDEPPSDLELPCAAANGQCTILGTGLGVGTYNALLGVPNVFQMKPVANSANKLDITFPFDPPGFPYTRTLR